MGSTPPKDRSNKEPTKGKTSLHRKNKEAGPKESSDQAKRAPASTKKSSVQQDQKTTNQLRGHNKKEADPAKSSNIRYLFDANKTKPTSKSKKTIAASDDRQKSSSNDANKTPFEEIESQIELFHDKEKTPYATINLNNSMRSFEIGSEDLHDAINLLHMELTGSIASKKLIKYFCDKLSLTAKYRSPEKEVYQRFAYVGDKIYIDLCDEEGTVVKVTKAGWEIIPTAPIKFIRQSNMQPLPAPVRGGNFKDILKYLNIHRPDDQILALTWPLVATISNIPRPILLLYGSPGSCKTSAINVLRGIIDPSSPMYSYVNTTVKDTVSYINSNAVPVFDNITRISKEVENLLCMTTTGDAISLRKLYTNLKNISIKLKKPMIITSLGIPTTAPDLLDRAIPVELERLKPTMRRDEESYKAELSLQRPLHFGGMCDALSRMLGAVEQVTLMTMPRMADYSKWGSAAAIALGFTEADFTQAYWRSTLRAPCDPSDDYNFARAVIDFLDTDGPVSNSVTIILGMFQIHVAKNGFAESIVPKAANIFSRRLKDIVPMLEAANWRVSWSDTARLHREITFSKVDQPE